jgi:hypothetical protein
VVYRRYTAGEPIGRNTAKTQDQLLAPCLPCISVSEVDWIEADDYSLELRLDPSCFLRIYRSTIVAIDRVAELRPIASGEYRVRLHTGITSGKVAAAATAAARSSLTRDEVRARG